MGTIKNWLILGIFSIGVLSPYDENDTHLTKH